jgi:ATP synthase protein I
LTTPICACYCAAALAGKDDGTKTGRAWFKAARMASIGLEMGVAVLIGWGVGYWLDGKLGTKPWLMLVFLLFGVAAGFKGMISAARESARQNAAETPEKTTESNERKDPD